MPVYLIKEMPYDEMMGWFEYLELRPVGWQEDDRTMKLLQAQGVKASPQDIFPSLRKISRSFNSEKKGDGTVASLRGSAMFSRLACAKGGDVINWE